MKKLLLTLSAVAGLGIFSYAQIYSENFNGTSNTTLPTGWSQTGSGWKTGNAASLNSQSFAIDDIDGRRLEINDDNDNADYSSQTVYTGTLNLSTGIAANLYAKFDMAYFAGTYQGVSETLTFVASTDGGSTWTTVETIPGNTLSNWQTVYVPLASYAGNSSVKLGFKYSDNNGWLFGAVIDNFTVLNLPAKDLAFIAVAPVQGSSSSYGLVGDSKTISGIVFNGGTSTVTSYVVKYQQGSNPVQSYTRNVTLAPFTYDTFTADAVPYVIPSVGEFPINVWVALAGDADVTNDSADAFVQGVANMPTKRLVFEEATGTWCGWCPRGAVGMDELSAEHPGAATQIAVHNSDPMTVSAYDGFITSLPGFSGFPSIVVDRREIDDPGDILAIYDAQKDYFGYAGVEMGTPTVAGTSVSVPVTITPAIDIANAKLALVITESNIRHTDAATPPNTTDTTWMQHNYYSPNMSGGPNEGGTIQLPLAGFDHASEYVDGMYYHFVARGGFPTPAGDASGLPASMTAGSTYNATLTGTINASWNQANLQYSVLLIGNDGTILNSAASATPTLNEILKDTVNAPDAVTNIPAGINNMELYPNPAANNVNISFDMKQAATMTLNIVDVTGKVIYTADRKLIVGNNTIEIPVNTLSNGNYFFTAHAQNGGAATIKFVVMH